MVAHIGRCCPVLHNGSCRAWRDAAGSRASAASWNVTGPAGQSRATAALVGREVPGASILGAEAGGQLQRAPKLLAENAVRCGFYQHTGSAGLRGLTWVEHRPLARPAGVLGLRWEQGPRAVWALLAVGSRELCFFGTECHCIIQLLLTAG